MTASATRWDHVWLAAVGVFASVWCLSAGRELGATFDEPFYLAKGLESWRTGSYRSLMRAGTMPLPVDVQTLPLFVWEQVRGQAFDPVSDLRRLLPIARGTNLLFLWLLLLYAGRLGRLWGGPWAGRWVVGMLGCEPNLLGHAALATTDTALTAGVLAAIYYYAVGRDEGWNRRVLRPGVAAGLAVACKASAVTFIPLAFLALRLPRCRRDLTDAVQTGAIAAGVLFAYCGCDWSTEPSFVRWADRLPDGQFADVMRFTADQLRIFPNAGEGIVQQVKHNLRGHGSYVLGEWHRRAVWYYFPVVLSAKLTEPVLVLLVGLSVFRPRAWLSPAGRVALVYLLFSLTCRVQIGVRLVFPLVVLLHMMAAVSLLGLAGSSRSRCWSRGLAVVSLALALLVAVGQWPHGLRYMNRFWGGPDRAGQMLTDSNFDWGQGLPELARWHAANGEPRLTVWYYGTDPAILLPPFHVFQLHHHPHPSAEVVRQTTGDGYFVVGASLLTSCPDRRPETLAVIRWLQSLQPVDRVGTFIVYRFD